MFGLCVRVSLSLYLRMSFRRCVAACLSACVSVRVPVPAVCVGLPYGAGFMYPDMAYSQYGAPMRWMGAEQYPAYMAVRVVAMPAECRSHSIGYLSRLSRKYAIFCVFLAVNSLQCQEPRFAGQTWAYWCCAGTNTVVTPCCAPPCAGTTPLPRPAATTRFSACISGASSNGNGPCISQGLLGGAA